jgi:hypothetical protein
MILTGGDALSDLVAARGLGITVEPGNVTSIVDALLQLLGDRPPAADFGPTIEEFQWPAVGAPLVRWIERARRAPDMPALELR